MARVNLLILVVDDEPDVEVLFRQLTHHVAIIEAAVVGRPDPVLGERVHAFIVPKSQAASAEEIRAFCAERLSDYKVPDRITFLSQPLPRNAAGKVLKGELRKMIEAEATA